jgi:hypothetical protein
MLHYTYTDQPATDLQQGDALKRTPELEALLRQSSPPLAEDQNNRYFIVLTQSCDLERRNGKPCKARVINVAAARPLGSIVREFIAERKILRSGFENHPAIRVAMNKKTVKQFLERLFNNNEEGSFYLHREPAKGFPEDYVAVLPLSAIVPSEAYEELLAARVLSLDGTFRDKLGWLLGKMFGQVGTRDWGAAELAELVSLALGDAAIWLDDRDQLRRLKAAVQRWDVEHPGEALQLDQLSALSQALASDADEAVDRALEIIRADPKFHHLLNEDQLRDSDFGRLRAKLLSDPRLERLLKKAGGTED